MSLVKCDRCGRQTSTLLAKCPYCAAPQAKIIPATFAVARYLNLIPSLLAASALFLSVPSSVSAYGRHRVAVEARLIAEKRAEEEARARAHAQLVRTARHRRDSLLKELPAKKLRRVSDAVLFSALAIARAPVEDTLGSRWIKAATIEVDRRERIRQEKAREQERRATAAARRQALLEERRERARQSAVPSGASAQCRDGTYSYSASRRGTCSHHGGVAVWY
jgi:hypothetical protein